MAIITSLNRSVRAPFSANDWRRAMKTAIRDVGQLCQLLQLPTSFEQAARQSAEAFGLFVPLDYAAKIRPGDPKDPLLRQILPVPQECDPAIQQGPAFSLDPVGDQQATLQPGLLKKYQGRALMTLSGACAVHCRYCFRRHYPYSETPRGIEQWLPALKQIEEDTTLEEIIFSGGDPLTLTDEPLAQLVERLQAIPHLRRLRVHTRLPIVIPQRVTDALLGWLTAGRLTPIVVVHANHPAELDGPVLDALRRLIDRGVTVLNQAVLLAGVNDDVDVLEELCRRLINGGVMPYYLHQLDRVVGAAHFEVPIERGRELIEQLRTRLPGYAIPRYVQERPGEANKHLLA